MKIEGHNPPLSEKPPLEASLPYKEGTLDVADDPQSSTSNFQFSKKERLCSEKLIDQLFHLGQRMMVFPYSIHWMKVPQGTLPDNIPAQVLIATSKKKFRHAVDRNRVKRLTRECYRLHKSQLYSHLNSTDTCIILSVNYIHNSIFDYHTLYHKFDKITEQLISQLSEPSPDTP